MRGFIVVILVIALFAAIAHLAHKKRQEQLARLRAIAARLGCTFYEDDPHGIAHMFRSLDKGDRRYVRDVISGTYEDTPLILFDIKWETDTTDSEGRTSTSVEWGSGAIASLHGGHGWPPLSLSPEGFFGRAKDFLGFRDQDFESDAFNKRFEIDCDDERFASALIDPKMMEWLMTTDRDITWELRGSKLLHLADRRDPEARIALHDQAYAFIERIPPVVKELYS